ncbi:OmpA family protein [Xanthomonas citri]|uniref:OmpA family protein n=1 Tax=Xanthomonas citri TaxID=346 RepID=UPI0001CECB79|nr:OmpA family protein [Xanthomonas citri]EFF42049.1 lipoprotein [Xanthomonas citri pv. aurantifolii str. ICPB 11122]
MRALALVGVAFAVSACSSHPKPPTVSGRDRVPVNSPVAAQTLQQEAFSPAPVVVVQHQGGPQAVQRQQAPRAADRPLYSVVSVQFPWNSAQFRPTPAQVAHLRGLIAAGVAHVQVRGRTDNPNPSSGDEHIARGRAEAAKDWLIGEGVPSGIIDLNFVSAGDYRSNNRLSDGRALNRRVDIEFISK